MAVTFLYNLDDIAPWSKMVVVGHQVRGRWLVPNPVDWVLCLVVFFGLFLGGPPVLPVSSDLRASPAPRKTRSGDPER